MYRDSVMRVTWYVWFDTRDMTHSFIVLQSTCEYIYVRWFGHASDLMFVKQLIRIQSFSQLVYSYMFRHLVMQVTGYLWSNSFIYSLSVNLCIHICTWFGHASDLIFVRQVIHIQSFSQLVYSYIYRDSVMQVTWHVWFDTRDTTNSYVVFQWQPCVFIYVRWFGHASDLTCVTRLIRIESFSQPCVLIYSRWFVYTSDWICGTPLIHMN